MSETTTAPRFATDRMVDVNGLEAELLALGWSRSDDVYGYRQYVQKSATFVSRNYVIYTSRISVDLHAHTDINVTTDIHVTDPIWLETLPVLCRYIHVTQHD